MTRWEAFKAALAQGGWTGLANTLIGVAATIGLLTAGQSSALGALVAGVATLLNLIVATVHTFQMARVLQANAMLLDEAVRLRSRLIELDDA
jgi:hypothetical protein